MDRTDAIFQLCFILVTRVCTLTYLVGCDDFFLDLNVQRSRGSLSANKRIC